MTISQLSLLVLACIGLLIGCTLILVGQAVVMCGRSKDIYPASLVRRLGTGLTGICIAVLLILYWQVTGTG